MSLTLIANVEPVRGVVELLEHTLEAAKRGEVRGVFIATTRVGGEVGTAWDHDVQEFDQFRLLGALRYAEHRLVKGVGG